MIKQRLTTQKRNRIFLCFKNDLTATQAADICGVNRNTANRYYGLLRRAILSESIREARREIGEYKLDEKVFVTVVADCSRESLMPIIKGLILEQSTIYTDGWRAYDGLVLNGYEHYRVFHSENEFVCGKSHVNGIENFWLLSRGCTGKRILIRKYLGVN